MDKKELEEEAQRRAKENQNAVGKNSGMSGRDLVRIFCVSVPVDRSYVASSSNTTPSGSRTTTRLMGPRTGISASTGKRRRTKIWLRRSRELLIWLSVITAITKACMTATPRAAGAGAGAGAATDLYTRTLDKRSPTLPDLILLMYNIWQPMYHKMFAIWNKVQSIASNPRRSHIQPVQARGVEAAPSSAAAAQAPLRCVF